MAGACPICNGVMGLAGMAIAGGVAIAGIGLISNALSGNNQIHKSAEDITKQQSPCLNCHTIMNTTKTKKGGIVFLCPNCKRKVVLSPDLTTSNVIYAGDAEQKHNPINNIWNI